MPKTTYCDAVRERALKAYKAACTDAEVAAIIGCSRETLRRWRRKHPEFAKAVALAKLPEDSDEQLAIAEERKRLANEQLTEFLRTGLARRIVVKGDGLGSFEREEYELKPDKWILERILGPSEVPVEPFQLEITVAEVPPPDDDEFFDGEEFDE